MAKTKETDRQKALRLAVKVCALKKMAKKLSAENRKLKTRVNRLEGWKEGAELMAEAARKEADDAAR